MQVGLHYAGFVGIFTDASFLVACHNGRTLTENKVQDNGNRHTAVVCKVNPRANPTFVTGKVQTVVHIVLAVAGNKRLNFFAAVTHVGVLFDFFLEVFNHGGDFFVGLHSGFRRVCTAVFFVEILIRRVVGTYGIFHVEAVFAKDKSVSVFVENAACICARVVAVVVVLGLFVIREVLGVAISVLADDTVKHASGDNCVKHIFVERRTVVCGVGLRNVFIENRAGSKVAENHGQRSVENEHKP